MKNGGRLPNIAVTLTAVGLLMLIPLLGVSAAQWNDTSSRYDAALQVDRSTQRLEVLLRLQPALHSELLAAGFEAGTGDFRSNLPEGTASLINFGPNTSLEAARADVDGLLEALADRELETALEDVRVETTGSLDALLEVSDTYADINLAVEELIQAELVVLNAAATVVGKADIALAARTAEAAADVRIHSSGVEGQWAQLAAASILNPSVDDVTEYNASLAAVENYSVTLDLVLPQTGTAREQWDALQSSEEQQHVSERYAQTRRDLAVAGVSAEPTNLADFNLADVNIAEALATAGRISATLDAAGEVDVAMKALVDTTLNDLRSASAAAVADAQQERRATLTWLVLAAALVVIAVIGVVLFIGRPIRRMADAARRLSRGDLNVRLAETGPAEVRIGSRALNHALASMRRTEAQAVALAEERLDDPVLQEEAPGELGASLQAAVRRLAVSLGDREEFQRRLAHEASHDGLTKISNRNAILHHLESAIARSQRSDTTVALLFLDLDDFKDVNDTHGHHAGDAVLQVVAQRLTTTVREGDRAGRLGGDEFVVVAEPVADEAEAVEVAQRLIAAVSAPIVFDGTTFIPKVSIGIGLASSETNADGVLRDADLAVYQAKSLGKDRIYVCDDELRRQVQDRATLESAINHAVSADEFFLNYQPSIDASTGEVAGYEALVRWHRDGEVVPPDEFIPVAERSDLIVEIDKWVLNHVVGQIDEWQSVPSMSNCRVAVNISGRHLGSGQLAQNVKEALAKHDVSPDLLELEVTETALLDDLVIAARDLAQVRNMGVRIALDDFGTGFMSLSHLRSLAVDVLKIDRSFVAEMSTNSDNPLVQLIVDTGHLLGIDVVAEGVEDASQAAMLKAMGVDLMQGFHFARPTPAADLVAETSIPVDLAA